MQLDDPGRLDPARLEAGDARAAGLEATLAANRRELAGAADALGEATSALAANRRRLAEQAAAAPERLAAATSGAVAQYQDRIDALSEVRALDPR